MQHIVHPKIELKPQVRIFSPICEDNRTTNLSLNSTWDKKDISDTISQINGMQQNALSLFYQELKEADAAEESQNFKDASKRTSNILATTQQKEVIVNRENGTLLEEQKKLIQMTEKLRNLHGLYQYRIQDIRNRKHKKIQAVMSIIEQLEKQHHASIQVLKNTLQHQKYINDCYIDGKVNDLKQSMEEIIQQNGLIKIQNSKLNEILQMRTKLNTEKKAECQQLKLEAEELRAQKEQFELIKLKQYKRYKTMLQIIDSNRLQNAYFIDQIKIYTLRKQL